MSDRPKGAIVVRSAEAGRLVGFANRGTAEERRQAIKDGLKASREMESEMSDPDRLRAAADICEQPYMFSGFKEPDPFAVALAVYLRIALLHVDEHVCPYCYAPHGNNTWTAIAQTDWGGDFDPCPVLIAALAVADTILGVGDE